MEKFRKSKRIIIIFLVLILTSVSLYNIFKQDILVYNNIASFSDLKNPPSDKFAELKSTKTHTLKYLVIHCTASKEGVDLKGKWFMNFFKKEKGWDRPGYNEIIELDGHRFIAVPYNLDDKVSRNEITYGVANYNSVTLNIAYVGGVDKKLKPKDTRTKAQKETIDKIIKEFQKNIPDIIVMGHRDFFPKYARLKECPSYDVKKEVKNLQD